MGRHPRRGRLVGILRGSCTDATSTTTFFGRSEVFLRIVGPKGNGFLWPTLVKFTTARVLITIRQISTGQEHVHPHG